MSNENSIPKPAESGVRPASFWDDADVVHVYTRREALEDGALIALDPGLVWEAGFCVPIAVTASVYADCIALTDEAKKAGNDVKGRTWDLLFMTKFWIRRAAKGADRVVFVEFHVVRHKSRAEKIVLKAEVGPGDDGEPVMTIMYPGED